MYIYKGKKLLQLSFDTTVYVMAWDENARHPQIMGLAEKNGSATHFLIMSYCTCCLLRMGSLYCPFGMWL